MVRLAVEKAKEIHLRHPGLSFPIDMEWLASAEGCWLIRWNFIPPVKEVKCGPFIGIAADLENAESAILPRMPWPIIFFTAATSFSFTIGIEPSPGNRKERQTTVPLISSCRRMCSRNSVMSQPGI